MLGSMLIRIRELNVERSPRRCLRAVRGTSYP